MTSEADLVADYDAEAAAGTRAGMQSRGRRDELRQAFVERLVADDRIRSMLEQHGVIDSFESWPNDRSDWCHQFVVLRV